MKQRVNSIWKWLSNLWGSFTKWITPVFSIGAIMVIISVVLIAFHNGILQAAGTAMLAAGLTIITTTLTSRESIRQQFAKEANTLRKDTIYGPLFIELKQIYERLEEAQKKERAYPLYIAGAGNEPEHTTYLRDLTYPTFLQWPQFRRDHRIDAFTHKARTMLDGVQNLIADYNLAIGATKNPAIDILTPHIGKAIAAWMEREDFKAWAKSGELPGDNTWHGHLKTRSIEFDISTMSKAEANTWVWFYGGLGWLVAGDGDKAAIHIQECYCRQQLNLVPPGQSWFQAIIHDAWSELDNLPEIKKTREVAEELRTRVCDAKECLEDGIRFIRDQYEGGKPPV